MNVAELIQKFAEFVNAQNLAAQPVMPVATLAVLYPPRAVVPVPVFADGFVPDMGEYGQPIPCGPDGLNWQNRGTHSYLTEQEKAAYLKWMQYNAGPSEWTSAILGASGLNYIGSPDYQHGVWFKTREAGNPNITPGPTP